MQLVSVGLDHTNSDLATRERLSIPGPALDEAHAQFRSRLGEGFILSTCNRTEVYHAADDAEAAVRRLVDFLAAAGRLDATTLLDQLTVRIGDRAAEQLFAVAGGLRSMVVGEDQILAQLKLALASAERVGALGATTHRLGTEALAVGKRVRAETPIGRHAVSVVSVALEVSGVSGGAAGRRVLVVGAGQTAELVLKHVADGAREGVPATVVNRDAENGRRLAERHGAGVRDWSELEAAVAGADVVVSCTSAPCVVIGADLVRRAQEARAGAPLVLVDLAMPRDVEPAAALVPGVRLVGLDQLEAICLEHRERRHGALGEAEKIVAQQVDRFRNWLLAREAAPTISALVSRATTIRDAEVERTLARMPELSEEQQAALRQMAARIVNKLMHGPLTALNEAPEPEIAAAVERLFGVTGGRRAEPAGSGARM